MEYLEEAMVVSMKKSPVEILLIPLVQYLELLKNFLEEFVEKSLVEFRE